MIFFVLLIAIIFLGGARFSKESKNYITKQQCNTIKGVFISLVFLSHAQQYILESGYSYDRIGDDIYLNFNASMGQLVVVMFLFYSGYGVMESFKFKGEDYWNLFPNKRILTTILNFDIAVLFFTILYILIGNDFSLNKLILSLLGWESMGNSNWYIFDIVLCYFSTWLAIYISKNSSNFKFLYVQSLLIILLFTALYITKGKETWWYDTLLAYLAGVVYSINKEKLEELFKQHYFVFIAIGLLLFFVFKTLMPLVNGKLFSSLPNAWYLFFGIYGNFCSVCFAVIVVMLSMKLKLHSRWLEWFGMNLFPLYIYQRISMISISQYHGGVIPNSYPYLFVIGCFIVSCVIASIYKHFRIIL